MSIRCGRRGGRRSTWWARLPWQQVRDSVHVKLYEHEGEPYVLARSEGRAFGFVSLRLPRSKLTAEDPAVLWTRYIQLTQIEAVFRPLKSELGIRPVYHRLERRVDAHIMVAFPACRPQVTLKNRLQTHAPGLTPAAVLE